jgi:hypothetical protein
MTTTAVAIISYTNATQIQPSFSHINTDCMDSVEDYDRQWEKRQTYMLRDIQIRDKIPNVTFISKGHTIEEHRSYLYAKKRLKMSKG